MSTKNNKMQSHKRRRLFGLVCSLALLGSAATSAGAAPLASLLGGGAGGPVSSQLMPQDDPSPASDESASADPVASDSTPDTSAAPVDDGAASVADPADDAGSTDTDDPADPADGPSAATIESAAPADNSAPSDDPSSPEADLQSDRLVDTESALRARPSRPGNDSADDPGTDASPDIELTLTAVTGTAPFDDEPGPGKDTSPDDEIIRTNDIVKYYVDAKSAQGGAGTLTFTIPKGQEVRNVPGWCKDADGSGALATPTPELSPPAVPLTEESWHELPAQTLVCAINMGQNVSERYFIPAFQRSEVPNNTVLDKPTVTLDMEDGRTASDDTELAQVVSAGPRWDVSKNHINNEENTGFINRVARACPWDETKSCWYLDHSLLIGSESSGKGASPLTGEVTLVDKLDPRVFYQDAGLDPSFWDDPANVEKYAPRAIKCSDSDYNYSLPNPKIGEGYNPKDAVHSVRDSGTATCEHTPGEDLTIKLNDTDWSLYTYPTKIPVTGRDIPQPGRAYAVAILVKIAIPLDAVRDLGYSGDNEDNRNLNYKNVYTDFHAKDLNGEVQDSTIDEPWNNYRTDTVFIRPPNVNANKFWAGVPGQPLNTPKSVYTAGDPTKEGPPGSTVQYAGDIPASAGQVVLSSLSFIGSNLSNPQKVSGLLCDEWDNTKLQLQAGDYPAGSTYGANMYASGGEAVWISGRLNFPKDYPFDLRVEYSGDAHAGPTKPSSDESLCRTGTWYSNPADVPGNDPAAAAEGRYTAVKAVRIYANLPEPKNTATWFIREHYSVALRVVEGQAEKTLIPNWFGFSSSWGSEFIGKEDLLAGGEAIRERPTDYEYESHLGTAGLGDRLRYAPAYVRVGKDVRLVGEEDFVPMASASAGDEVEWRIRATLHSAAPLAGTPQPVVIEDCLPPDFRYVSASVAPSLVQSAPAPADAELTCDEGTYIKWILEDRLANENIDPIILKTKISAFAITGTYNNHTSVQTDPIDPTPLEDRMDDAGVDVASIQGVRIEKNALTPVTQINAADNDILQHNEWEVALYNQDYKEPVRNVDVIDALPVKTGLNGSSYEGTMTFVSAEVTDGDNVQLLYTKAENVNTDPKSPDNGDTGTPWCDAPAGGALVKGTGECPATANEVTGLRMLKPTPLPSGEGLTVKITMVPEGNAPGNIYVNKAEASVEGLKYNVGPVDAQEEVIASTLGDYVWSDLDRDGIQDATEDPYTGLTVRLNGTDDLGNAVSAETTSAADGKYSFEGLREGDYTITFVPDGLPTNRELSPRDEGADDAIDSDGDPASGKTEVIALKSGESRTDVDEGISYKVGEAYWYKIDTGQQPIPRSANPREARGAGNPHTREYLAGSEWLLRGTDPLTQTQGEIVVIDCVEEPCTGPDTDPHPGYFSVDDLLWGDYELVETKAPAGFILDPTPHTFTLAGSWGYVGEFVNKPYSFDLPHTGGVASLIFLGMGGGLLGLAAVSGGAQMRRRPRKQS